MQGSCFSRFTPFRGLISAFLLWLITGFIWAEPAPLKIPRVTRPPRLEDFIEGRPREAEAAISTFTQFDPHDGAPVTQPTMAYLSYDRENLYVAWICKDDPKLIRARIAPRKTIDTDDRVTINIDTFLDRKHAYWFDVNPYGVQFDGRTTDGIGDDTSWEGLWYTDGRIVGDGYVVLETIPFRTLRFPRAPRQVWNILLARFIERSNEMSCWPAMTHDQMPKFVGQFAPIEIDEDIVPGRNLQFVPYGLLSHERFLNSDKGFQTDKQHHPGLDAKAVFDGAFTLDVTVNPDFAEIGSDDPKVTADQRYKVTFPERRLFFLENSSAFSTPETLFFSRYIADPQYGAKLTGTEGKWGLGLLVANDRAPGENLAVGSPHYGEHAIDAVGRLEREIRGGQHMGLFLSQYKFANDWNRVASLDSRFLLPNNWTLKGQATTTQYQSEGNPYQAGPGFNVSIKKNDNHLSSSTYYVDRSPGMNAVLGYLNRVDIRDVENYEHYFWKPKHGPVLAFGPSLYSQAIYNHKGQLQNWEYNPGFSFSFPRLGYLAMSHSESYERYENTDLRENLSAVSFGGSPYKWMDLSTILSWGHQPNYDNQSGIDPFVGSYNYAATTLTFYAYRHLRMDNIYYYTHLGGNNAQLSNNTTASGAVFNNHLVRSKINYQFTRDYSFHAILDYNSMLPNNAWITDSYAKNADTTLLFTYMPHPGTAVHVGYQNNFQNVAWNSNSGQPALSTITDPSTQTDSQFFIKVSYLLRF